MRWRGACACGRSAMLASLEEARAAADEPAAPRPLMVFDNVSFRAGSVRILSGVDLDIHAGAPTVLLGPNGSGKTTALKLAMGLITPSEGRIAAAGVTGTAELRKAFVFQKPMMLRRTAAANVAYALAAAGRRADPAKTAQLLHQVGLGALANRAARRLSGGEQQRLALARALAREPDLLLLDEPTASLDPAATRAVEDIIAGVAAAGIKIVMSTH